MEFSRLLEVGFDGELRLGDVTPELEMDELIGLVGVVWVSGAEEARDQVLTQLMFDEYDADTPHRPSHVTPGAYFTILSKPIVNSFGDHIREVVVDTTELKKDPTSSKIFASLCVMCGTIVYCVPAEHITAARKENEVHIQNQRKASAVELETFTFGQPREAFTLSERRMSSFYSNSGSGRRASGWDRAAEAANIRNRQPSVVSTPLGSPKGSRHPRFTGFDISPPERTSIFKSPSITSDGGMLVQPTAGPVGKSLRRFHNMCSDIISIRKNSSDVHDNCLSLPHLIWAIPKSSMIPSNEALFFLECLLTENGDSDIHLSKIKSEIISLFTFRSSCNTSDIRSQVSATLRCKRMTSLLFLTGKLLISTAKCMIPQISLGRHPGLHTPWAVVAQIECKTSLEGVMEIFSNDPSPAVLWCAIADKIARYGTAALPLIPSIKETVEATCHNHMKQLNDTNEEIISNFQKRIFGHLKTKAETLTDWDLWKESVLDAVAQLKVCVFSGTKSESGIKAVELITEWTLSLGSIFHNRIVINSIDQQPRRKLLKKQKTKVTQQPLQQNSINISTRLESQMVEISNLKKNVTEELREAREQVNLFQKKLGDSERENDLLKHRITTEMSLHEDTRSASVRSVTELENRLQKVTLLNKSPTPSTEGESLLDAATSPQLLKAEQEHKRTVRMLKRINTNITQSNTFELLSDQEEDNCNVLSIPYISTARDVVVLRAENSSLKAERDDYFSQVQVANDKILSLEGRIWEKTIDSFALPSNYNNTSSTAIQEFIRGTPEVSNILKTDSESENSDLDVAFESFSSEAATLRLNFEHAKQTSASLRLDVKDLQSRLDESLKSNNKLSTTLSEMRCVHQTVQSEHNILQKKRSLSQDLISQLQTELKAVRQDGSLSTGQLISLKREAEQKAREASGKLSLIKKELTHAEDSISELRMALQVEQEDRHENSNSQKEIISQLRIEIEGRASESTQLREQISTQEKMISNEQEKNVSMSKEVSEKCNQLSALQQQLQTTQTEYEMQLKTEQNINNRIRSENETLSELQNQSTEDKRRSSERHLRLKDEQEELRKKMQTMDRKHSIAVQEYILKVASAEQEALTTEGAKSLQIVTLQENMNSMQSQMEQKINDINSLTRKAETLESELAASKTRILQLECSIVNDTEGGKQQTNQLVSEIEILQKQLHENKQTQQVQNETSKHQIDVLSSERDTLREELTAARDELNITKQNNIGLEMRIEKMPTAEISASLHQTINNKAAELQNKDSEVTILNNKLTALEESKQTAESQFQLIRESLNVEIIRLNSQLKDLSDRNESLIEDIEKRTETTNSLLPIKEQLHQTQQQLTQLQSSADDKIDQLSGDYREASNQNKELNQKCDILKARLETEQKQNTSLSSKYDRCRQAYIEIVEEAKQNIISAAEGSPALELEIQSLKTDREINQKKISRLQEELCREKSKNDTTAIKLDQRNDELRRMELAQRVRQRSESIMRHSSHRASQFSLSHIPSYVSR